MVWRQIAQHPYGCKIFNPLANAKKCSYDLYNEVWGGRYSIVWRYIPRDNNDTEYCGDVFTYLNCRAVSSRFFEEVRDEIWKVLKERDEYCIKSDEHDRLDKKNLACTKVKVQGIGEVLAQALTSRLQLYIDHVT